MDGGIEAKPKPVSNSNSNIRPCAARLRLHTTPNLLTMTSQAVFEARAHLAVNQKNLEAVRTALNTSRFKKLCS